MRNHIVNCQIEGNMPEVKKIVYQKTNEFYIDVVEQIIEKSGWTKDMQLVFLDRLIDFFEKNEEEVS